MKCAWCNQEGEGLIEVTLETGDRLAMNPRAASFRVHADHEAAFRAFHGRVDRYGRFFLLAVVALILACVVLEVVGLVSGEMGVVVVLIGCVVAALGGLMIAFPFGTPETVRLLGVRTTMRLTRGAGVTLVLVALGVMALGVRRLG